MISIFSPFFYFLLGAQKNLSCYIRVFRLWPFLGLFLNREGEFFNLKFKRRLKERKKIIWLKFGLQKHDRNLTFFCLFISIYVDKKNKLKDKTNCIKQTRSTIVDDETSFLLTKIPKFILNIFFLNIKPN